MTRNGVRLEFGSRQHYCPSSPHYQERALALTARLAQRYADHPALAMWHVNNEYGCHVSACYCDVSADHFRVWLKDRYSGLGALNSAWNTAFWGQHYGDWAHIEPPRAAPFYANPNHLLEWQRFCSDALLELYKSEAAILKEVTPDIPVTTNFMGFFRPLDYWRWAPELDVVADDSYPDPADPDAALGAALNYDLMRSLRGGQPWILMEQATSAVQWREVNKAKGPGLMRLWSYQALARGADGVMFFQWRASRAGAEAFHSAMLPHTGPDSRVFAEVKALGQELKTLSELRHSRINADVAVLFDWSNWWALEGEAKPARLDLLGHVHELYRPLWQNNVTVDFVSPEHELGAYKLVLAPNLYLLPQDLGEKLEMYVRSGGTLLTSYFSGIVDGHLHAYLGGYVGPLRAALGLYVEEFDPLLPDEVVTVETRNGQTFQTSVWRDEVKLEGAEALAFYDDRRAAVARHGYGRGHALYCGTQLNREGTDWLITTALATAGVPVTELPTGIERVRRTFDGTMYTFYLNHSQTVVSFEPEKSSVELLTGEARDIFTLEPRSVLILKSSRSAKISQS